MVRLGKTAPVLMLAAFGACAATPAITGFYVEVRSNHVYTCGCLYSGEQVTGGREAILAWDIREGAYQDVALAGVKAVAVVQGAGNLGLQGVPRRSVVFTHGSSQPAQQAVLAMLKEYYGAVLGDIQSVHSAPITIEQEGERVAISVAGVSRVVVRPARLPEDAHQGSLLWYAPFIPAPNPTLSTTEYWSFSGGHFRQRWWESEAGITAYMASFRLP